MGWDYYKGEISIAGFFVDDKIIQFMLMNKNKLNNFQKEVKNFLSTLNEKKLHAFNVKMETGCFTKLLGNSPQFHEIMPFRGKGANKEYHFNYLIKKGVIPSNFMKFKDPLNGRSELCLKYWEDQRFKEVGLHNVCCLTKEATILQHRDFIIKQFNTLLDENGWLKSGASLPPL